MLPAYGRSSTDGALPYNRDADLSPRQATVDTCLSVRKDGPDPLPRTIVWFAVVPGTVRCSTGAATGVVQRGAPSNHPPLRRRSISGLGSAGAGTSGPYCRDGWMRSTETGRCDAINDYRRAASYRCVWPETAGPSVDYPSRADDREQVCWSEPAMSGVPLARGRGRKTVIDRSPHRSMAIFSTNRWTNGTWSRDGRPTFSPDIRWDDIESGVPQAFTPDGSRLLRLFFEPGRK